MNNRTRRACGIHLQDIEVPCPRCHGEGSVLYGSTATWRGGMGGAAMTRDQCDHCWGSGDAERPWPNIRDLEAKLSQSHQVDVREALARWVGYPSAEEKANCAELAEQFAKQSRRRSLPTGISPFWWARTCEALESFFRQLAMAERSQSVSPHPLAPFVATLLTAWTGLHKPSTDPGEIGSRDALRSLVAGVARFLKVEMPK